MSLFTKKWSIPLNGIFTSVNPMLHSIMESSMALDYGYGFSLNEPSTANINYCE